MKPEYYYLISVLSEDWHHIEMRLISAPNSQEARFRARQAYCKKSPYDMDEIRANNFTYGNKHGESVHRKLYATRYANQKVDDLNYFRMERKYAD